MKKILSIFLAITMIASLFVGTLSVTSSAKAQGFTFECDADEAEETGVDFEVEAEQEVTVEVIMNWSQPVKSASIRPTQTGGLELEDLDWIGANDWKKIAVVSGTSTKAAPAIANGWSAADPDPASSAVLTFNKDVDITSGKKVAEFYFTVPTDAEPGDTYTITLSIKKISSKASGTETFYEGVSAQTITFKVPAAVHTCAADTSKWSSDGTNHWNPCTTSGCTTKFNEAAHAGGTATCQAKAKCATCQAEYGNLGSHNWDTAWTTDATNHWHKCLTAGCTEKNGSAAHIGGSATCQTKPACSVCSQSYGEFGAHVYDQETKTYQKSVADCQHYATYWMTCTCGAVSSENYWTDTASGYGAHNWDTAWTTDGTNHWHKCLTAGCTEKNGSAAHSGGTATCQAKAKCATCQAEYGELGSHNWDTAWTTDATNHWHKCLTAGCTEKNGSAAHTGGSATCSAKAVCSVCSQSYGEFGSHSFTQETKTNLRSAADCKNYATYYKTCACGAASTTEYWTDSASGYGSHNWDTAWTTDGTNHWHKCLTAGCTEKNGSAAHSGGTATCQAKAKCATCQAEYGNLGSHNWDTAWTTDGANHWHKCLTAGCTEKNGSAAHSGGTATCQAKAVCSACAQEYGNLGSHNWDTAWTTDATNHWHKCLTAGCTEKNDNAAHSGGTATCQAKAVCSACAQEYGELGSHNFDTAWTTDDANHWHKCLTAGCTEKNGSAAHTVASWEVTKQPTATETGEMKGVCTVCEKSIVKSIPTLTDLATLATTKAAANMTAAEKAALDNALAALKSKLGDVTVEALDLAELPAIEMGAKVPVEGTITVPVPANAAGKTGLKLIMVDAAGNSQLVEFTNANGNLTFAAKANVSYYLVNTTAKANGNDAESGKTSPKTGENNFALWIALILVSCLGVLSSVAYGRKRSRR